MAEQTFPKVDGNTMATQSALRDFIIHNQTGVMKGPRTNLSMTGGRQFNVTASSLSDILQGTMSVRGPSEMNAVINKALTNNLDYLYGSDYSTVSAFSTAKYDFHAREGGAATDNPDSGGGGGSSEGTVSTHMAAGMLANIQYESNFNSDNDTGDGGTSGGLFQHHAGRWAALKTYAVETGRVWSDWKAQCDFALKECKESYTNINLQATDAKAAARQWCIEFERPTDASDKADQRAAVADGYIGGGNHTSGNVTSKEVYNYLIAAGGGGGGGGGGFTTGSETVEAVLYAGSIVAGHKNNWMAQNESGFKNILTKGGGDSTHCTYKTSSGGLFFPSILNYLWTIFEGGYLISGSGSLIENRNKNTGSGELSNHATGGAVDIFKIGYASEGKVYGKGDSKYETVCDSMYTYLSTFPKDGWADEHGWITRRDYGGSDFHTYRDNNPNHSHFGFGPKRSGSLLPALKKK